MNLIEKINKISLEAKNQFKPDLKKYGKNFRAISDSAILDVLNPLFEKYKLSYDVVIMKSDLQLEHIRAGRDNSGNIVEKLLFVASAVVRLVVHNPETTSFDNPDKHETLLFDGWGSGTDYGDKATGKAITAAVKYALFKGLRLQYSDDPDAEASEEIESIVEEEKPQEKGSKSAKKEEKEVVATESQLNYIKGLVVACGITDNEFKEKYGFLPYDAKMPMKRARSIIDELKKIQDEKLPF